MNLLHHSTVLTMIKKFKIFHPFLLLAIFTVLLIDDIISDNIIVHWNILLYGILIILLTSVGIVSLCRIVKFDIIRSSIFLTINLFFILFYIQIMDLIAVINRMHPFLTHIQFKGVTFGFYLIVVLAIFLILKLKKKADFVIFNSYLNFILLVLLLVNLYNLINFRKSEIKLENKIDISQPAFSSITFPDIYYFNLDAYTSSESLKQYFKFDNSDFENKLREKGFYIASNSHCNYNITVSSFASFTNSSYLNIKNNAILSTYKQSKLYNLRWDNQILSFFKKMNYNIHFYKPDLSLYDEIDTELKIENSLKNYSLFNNTLYYHILKYYISGSKRLSPNKLTVPYQKRWYDYSIDFFPYADSIAKIRTEQPKFLMSYSYAPHGSFSFAMDENGTFKELNEIPDIKTRYLNQVQYMNNGLVSLIDSIQKASTREVIIIIHADHGSHNFDLKETTTILNAFYFSDKNYGLLYDSISPVNNFRVILKKYFDPDIELLKDETFYTFYGHSD